MSRRLRLSKEHGLNPSLAVCAYCGEDTGEIILFGASRKENSMKVICSMEPCSACKESKKEFIAFFCMEGERILGTGFIKETAFRSIFNQDPGPRRVVQIDKQVLEWLQKQSENPDQEEVHDASAREADIPV